jgi:hypothetical protein
MPPRRSLVGPQVMRRMLTTLFVHSAAFGILMTVHSDSVQAVAARTTASYTCICTCLAAMLALAYASISQVQLG